MRASAGGAAARTPRGLSYLDVVAGAAICVAVVALLGSWRFSGTHHGSNRAHTIRTLAIALERYHDDFKAYPPDNIPSTNGSEVLWHHLCRKHTVGDMKYGPYIDAPANLLRDTNAAQPKRFVTSLGFDYTYRVLNAETSFIVIDPGPDGKVGGRFVTGENGATRFEPVQTDKGMPNSDDDNIYSNDLKRDAP